MKLSRLESKRIEHRLMVSNDLGAELTLLSTAYDVPIDYISHAVSCDIPFGLAVASYHKGGVPEDAIALTLAGV